MEVLEVNCNRDNQLDNNEISRSDVNCLGRLSKAASAQLTLRKCQSDSNVRRRSRVDKMGARISRSRSADSVPAEIAAYESLLKDKKKDERSLCSFGDSDEEYKILESSELDSGSEADDENDCATFEQCPSALSYGHDSAENSRASNDYIHRSSSTRAASSAGNETRNDLLCEKSSTLPRVNHPKCNVEHEVFAACKPFDYRGQVLQNEVKVMASDNGQDDTSEVLDDKPTADFTQHRSTTLPKTRSRLSEPYSRLSLRRAIDSTMLRKHSSISDAPTHSAVIIPAGNESTSGTGKRMFLCANIFRVCQSVLNARGSFER